jgi:hypothetical protein
MPLEVRSDTTGTKTSLMIIERKERTGAPHAGMAQCNSVAQPWPGTWTWKVLPPMATLIIEA